MRGAALSGYVRELPKDSEFMELQAKFPIGSTVRRKDEEGTVGKLNGCAAYVSFDDSPKNRMEWVCLTELEAMRCRSRRDLLI